MDKHSYLSTWLVDLNNIKMYTVDKQYKNRRHIGLNAWHFNKTANVTAAYEHKTVTYERAWVILFNRCYFNVLFFDLKHNVRDTDVDLSAFKHFSGLK